MSAFATFDIAGSALSAQSLRLNLTASNLANMHDVAGAPADVYRARQALFRASQGSFSSALAGAASGVAGAASGIAGAASGIAGVDVLGVVESVAPPIERYDPGNSQADENGLVYAANINAMEEMANMISASRSYQSNLEVINTAKDLMLRTLTLGQA